MVHVVVIVTTATAADDIVPLLLPALVDPQDTGMILDNVSGR